MCVNRLDSSATTDAVSEFLKKKGVTVHSCYRIEYKHKSNLQQNYIGMRVCVSHNDLDQIFQDDMWSSGVTVRPWVFKQRLDNAEQTQCSVSCYVAVLTSYVFYNMEIIKVVSLNCHGFNVGSDNYLRKLCVDVDVLLLQEKWLSDCTSHRLKCISDEFVYYHSSAMEDKI